MQTLESQIRKAIRRYWPCQRKSSCVALTAQEFEHKVDCILSVLSMNGSEMRAEIASRLSPQWVRLPPLDTTKDNYQRTYPSLKKKADKRTSAFAEMEKQIQRAARKDGYQMFRKDESRTLKWRQIR